MRLALLCALATIAACAPPYYLRNHASGALRCPEDAIEVRTIVAPSRFHPRGVYVASGCGRTVEYECLEEDCDAR